LCYNAIFVLKRIALKIGEDQEKLWPVIQPYIFTPVAQIALIAITCMQKFFYKNSFHCFLNRNIVSSR